MDKEDNVDGGLENCGAKGYRRSSITSSIANDEVIEHAFS